jgi:hypothetical protein
MLNKPQVWLSNMSLLKAENHAYSRAQGYQTQAEEHAAMLKEFNRIAREMLFMHGHLTRPADWAESADPGRGQAVGTPRPKRGKGRRFAMAAAACGIVPTRLINAQLR